MIFARYKGGEKGSGFTPGKVYVAKSELDSGDTVCYRSLEMKNDEGATIQVKPHTEMVQSDDRDICEDVWDFEFLEEVYAVVVRDEVFKGQIEGGGEIADLRIGQVVVIDDAEVFKGQMEGGGEWKRLVYSVKGVGFHSSSSLVILDRTNVFPDMMLCQEETGRWLRVRIVDECLWVTVDGLEGRRSPEEFRFAVKDGEIMVEPIVECVDESSCELTEGHRYYVIKESNGGDEDSRIWFVINDLGHEEGYFARRFRV